MNILRVAFLLCISSSALFAQSPSIARASRETQACSSKERLTVSEFEAVMRQVAEGWNENDARKAAECFTEDAIYSAPPSFGHEGKEALFQFFGGEKGRQLPMHMTWHRLVFDPSQQAGAGEYTFRYKIQTHGVVMVKFSRGKISNWREYEIESNAPWEQFVGKNRF